MTDYDFIEIGTSDFDTLLELSTSDTFGISIDPLKIYLDKLPDKKNVKKINCAISNRCGTIDIFYIEPITIKKLKLPDWIKGCNSITAPHPTVYKLLSDMKYNPLDIIRKDSVIVKDIKTLMIENNVKSIKTLKIDTEGHDCVILDNYIDYCLIYPNLFAKKIIFETNVLSSKDSQDHIINRLISNGYSLISRNTDTILNYN